MYEAYTEHYTVGCSIMYVAIVIQYSYNLVFYPHTIYNQLEYENYAVQLCSYAAFTK